MKPRLTLIAAIDKNRLLSNEKGFPWHQPKDVAHFRAYTANKWLLIGRRTYEEMIGWFREGHVPLILTRQTDYKAEVGQVVGSVEEALRLTEAAGQSELVCVGGGKVFETCLPYADLLVLTEIPHRFNLGEKPVFFPPWSDDDWKVDKRQDIPHDAENVHDMTISYWVRASAE